LRRAMNQHIAARAVKTQLYLTPADHGRLLGLEEFESADAQEGCRYELIRGRLEVSPVPTLPHERLLKWLARLLDDYTRQYPEVINEVFGPARVFVPDLEEGVTAPEPDLAGYHDFPSDLPCEEVNWRDVSPMVVVEVISADTADKDLTRNVPLYLRVPTVREYWIVDPRESHDRPSLLVYRRRGQSWQKLIRIKAGGTYTTRLLPGFTVVLNRRA
jgi:Uma2 family endonuclease